MALADAIPYLSAEQLQQLAGYGIEPSSTPPAQAFIESMAGSSPAEILQATGPNPSLSQAVAENLGLTASDYTFENPFRADLKEFLLVGTGEVLTFTGGANWSPSPPTVPTTQLWQNPRGDPQTNFPPRGAPPPEVFPPQNRLPVPYEPVQNPGPWAFGIGGVGAILGGIIGAMIESDIPGIGTIPGFPNALDPELGPYDTRAPSAAPDVIMSGPSERDLEEGPIEPFGPDIMREPVPGQPGAPYDFGDVYERARKAMEEQLVKDMTTPAPVPPPAPAPAPTPRELPPWVWPLIGGLGAIGIGRAGRSRSSQTLPSISVLPTPGLTAADVAGLIEPLLSSNQLSSTSSFTQTSSGGVWDTSGGTDTCNCTRKTGKKRKCLAKAQLSWRSGPKKGRAAGTRCYRFAE